MARTSSYSPIFAPAAAEDVLSGGRLLRRAFLETEIRSAERGTILIQCDQRDPPALLIHRGLAYSATSIPDGRRAITDLFLTEDIVGAGNSVMGEATQDVVAAYGLHYRLLRADVIRNLMVDRQIATRVLALGSELRHRAEQHMAALTQLDARERICRLVFGVYERLRRRDLINRPTFNLWLTQEEIGDHLGLTMVHVSRTLRRLREEKIVLVDRHVVVILDIDALLRIASGSDRLAHGLASAKSQPKFIEISEIGTA